MENSSISNLKNILVEKHNNIENIANMILFYESKINSLQILVNDKKENLQKNIKKLSEEQEVLTTKTKVIQSKINITNDSINEPEKQNKELDTFNEIKRDIESKWKSLNEIEQKLKEKDLEVKNRFKQLSDEEKSIYLKFLNEYDQNKQLKQEADDYISKNSIINIDYNNQNNQSNTVGNINYIPSIYTHATNVSNNSLQQNKSKM